MSDRRWIILLNPHARENRKHDLAAVQDDWKQAAREHDVDLRIVELTRDLDLGAILRQERDAGGETFLAAGGDGTLKTLIEAFGDEVGDVTLGVIPGGTVNMLARDLGISLKPGIAMRQLLRGATTPVDTAWIKGELCLVSASVGLFASLAAAREAGRRLGLKRRLKHFFIGIPRAFIRQQQVRLKVHGDGTPLLTRRRYWLVSIYNNPLDDEVFPLPRRQRLDTGKLVLYAPRYDHRGTMLRFLFSVLWRGWTEREDLEIHRAQRFRLDFPGRKRVRVMVDGEIRIHEPPLEMHLDPGALTLLAPSDEDRETP